MFLDCMVLSMIHLFWDFLKYFLTFETNTALEVAIKYFFPTSTLSNFHFKTVGSPSSLSPESARSNCAGAKASCYTAHVESICSMQGGHFVEWITKTRLLQMTEKHKLT